MAAATKKLMDIEVYVNYFLVGIKDLDTKEIINYEISEFKDDRVLIYNFFKTYDGFLVTFNGIHYDNMVINYFMKCYRGKLANISTLEVCAILKQFSNEIIINSNPDRTKSYKNYNPNWMDIDLFLYWSLKLRKDKQISLKSLGVQLQHEEIQELPYPHEKVLEDFEMEELKRYNNLNDLGILEKLFYKQLEEVRLRRFIKYEYGLECWSFDAPKIASELLLKDYCKQTQQLPKVVKDKTFHYLEYLGTIGDLIKDVEITYQNNKLKEAYQNICKSKRANCSEEFVINDQKNGTNIKISVGIGGIHSEIKDTKFNSDEKFVIISSDVASMYPKLIINHKLCRFPEVLNQYQQVRDERIIAKREKLKQKDTLLKLILNSFSGLIDSAFSWLYYPQGALKLRMLGQLIELKVVDECLSAGIKVIALNTDSVDVLIERKRVDEYYDIVERVSKQYDIVFEHEEIDFTYYCHINAYIQKASNGKIKRKGSFRYGEDIPLGDPVNEQVVPKALELYFTKNIPVSESISNPEKYGFHIYDYCLSKKVSKSKYDVYHNGIKVQNLNRYYFSKNDPYLYKKKHEKTKPDSVHAKEGVRLFNTYKELSWEEYNVNYKHYIKKASDIIYGLEKSQIQLTLF